MATHPGQLTAPDRAVAHSAPDAVYVRDLVRSFGTREVLKSIDLTIPRGEFTALLGHSGSGKSTLLRAIAGLDHGVAGSGQLLVPRRLSLVFQDARLLPWLKVLDNVVLGREGRDVRKHGKELLAEVGLAGRENSWPYQLSGGEQQRVALARSLVSEPELLLADEPFGALDALTRLKMHSLLLRLVERHRPTVLLVTHDVDEAVRLADRVIVIADGELAVDCQIDVPREERYGNPKLHAHRIELLAHLGVTLGE